MTGLSAETLAATEEQIVATAVSGVTPTDCVNPDNSFQL